MIIEIPPQLESVIIMQAQKHGMTAQTYVLDQLEKITVKDDMLVTDFMAQIPPLDIFKDIDPVSYQRETRNEWY